MGRSLSKERKITNDDNDDTNESRQVESTRVLNNNWVEMHFKKTFCDKLDEERCQWLTVSKKKADEIKVKMEEDQGESIKFIHKYRDSVTNEIKYCVARDNTGGKQKSKGVHIIKQKEIDIDWIYGLCRDQQSMEWYHKLVFKLELNSTLLLPIASMKKITDVNDVLKKKEGVPSIQFIQSEGTCGFHHSPVLFMNISTNLLQLDG